MNEPNVKSQKGITAVGAAVVAFIAKMRRRDGGGTKRRATASDVR